MKTEKQMKKKLEVNMMDNRMKLQMSAMSYTKELDLYIKKLKKQKSICKEDALEDAKLALKRTGVTTKSGRTKKKIVSWE